MNDRELRLTMICDDDRPSHDERAPGDGHTRRQFLQRASCAVGALAALGLPAEVMALPISEVSGESSPASDAVQRYPIPSTDSVKIDRKNEVILVRYQGRVYAFGLWCPHQNTALNWVAGDHQFQCPKHHSKYQPTGQFISGRATRNMDRYGITKDGTSAVVDLDMIWQSDKDAAQWQAASIPA
ncbi:MAG: Rieske (2Fe-2S) protein [Acidobacteriota bacterium]|nr:Rieske (2Fe-2S) protein [Acidobacteriota bacterium]